MTIEKLQETLDQCREEAHVPSDGSHSVSLLHGGDKLLGLITILCDRNLLTYTVLE